MSGYKGHITGAILFFVAYIVMFGYALALGLLHIYFDPLAEPLTTMMYIAGLFVVTLLFGLWPDVDTDSKGRRIFYRIFLVVDLYLIVVGHYEAAAYLGLLAILPGLGPHRGWTHTWWAMLVVPLPFLVVPYFRFPEMAFVGAPFYVAAVVGYFSHLVLDGLVIPKKLMVWRD